MKVLPILIGALGPRRASLAADDPIAVRQALMDNNGAAAAVAGGILKDEIPYNPAVAKGVISALNATALRLRQLLPRGQRRSGASHASPKIWEDPAGFAGRTRQVLRPPPRPPSPAAGKEGPADKAAFAAAMQPIFGSCKSCHETLPHARTEPRCGGSSAGSSGCSWPGSRRSSISRPCRAACRPPSWRRCPRATPTRGETWFWAGGCASCHAAEKAEGRGPAEARRRPGARHRLRRLRRPQHLPRPDDGIGGWSAGDFANAMLRGVVAGRAALSTRLPLRLLHPDAAAGHRRPLGLPADAAGRAGPAAPHDLAIRRQAT